MDDNKLTKICRGCLCSDRKISLIDNFCYEKCFFQLIDDFPILNNEESSLFLCWECKSELCSYYQFKQKANYSNRVLQDSVFENPDTLEHKHCSRLIIKNIFNISVPEFTSIKKEDSVDEIKSEHSVIIHLAQVEENLTVNNDSCDINDIPIENDKLSDNDNLSDNDDSKLSDSEVFLNVLKSKKKKKKTRKKVVQDVQEFELTNEEIDNERTSLWKSESFINALYKCNSCIQPFPNAEDLKDHFIRKHNIKAKFHCTVCECSFTNVVTFNYHSTKHKKRFKCMTCNDVFVTKHLAQKHYRTYHCDNTYTCTICNDIFDTFEELHTHKFKHNSDKEDVYSCESCDKVFRWKTSLRKHLECHRIENGEKRKPFCETCKLSFTTTSSLQKHVRNSAKHQILLKSRVQGAVIEAELAKEYKKRAIYECTQCSKKFQWRGNLARHMKSHEARANGQLICVPCNKSFSSIATYNQHLSLSMKHISENDFKFVCNDCGQKFPKKMLLQDHINWVHLKKFTHVCDVCQKVFKSHTSLYLHKQVVHEKHKSEHLCDHCGKAFPNRAKLRTHIMALHSSDSPYKCKLCNAKFNWHSCLSRHIRILHKIQKKEEKN